MTKEELEIREDIAKHLNKSNSQLWSELSNTERDRVVEKYLRRNSIENIGLYKVLDDIRDTRRSFAAILIGLLLGLLGSVTGSILLSYMPDDKKGIHFINLFIVLLFGLIVWKFIQMIEDDGIQSLREERVLEYLVKNEQHSPNVQIVLDILKNEAEGGVASAFAKMTDDYSMTWMYQAKDGSLFPSTGENIKAELDDVYPIKGREYDIRNITESENVVIIEVIESYPDPDTGQMYRTPQAIVLELENGKIKTGRHYCDPRLSFLELSKEDINKALRNTSSKTIIS